MHSFSYISNHHLPTCYMIYARLSRRCSQSLIKSHNYRDCTGVRHHSLFVAPRKGRGGEGGKGGRTWRFSWRSHSHMVFRGQRTGESVCPHQHNNRGTKNNWLPMRGIIGIIRYFKEGGWGGESGKFHRDTHKTLRLPLAINNDRSQN